MVDYCRMVEWVGDVVGMGRRHMFTGKRDDSKDPDVNERIILKLIYNKWDVNSWTGLIRYGIKASGALLRKVISSLLT